MPFANFGTVVLNNAVATSHSGVEKTPAGATIWNIVSSSGQVLTSVKEHAHSVTVKHL